MSQTSEIPPDDAERAELLISLDEAEREICEGESYTADELREAVREWVRK